MLEIPADCRLCPRLAAFRDQNRLAYPDYFNGAVPSFGPRDAEILILGLAPGLKGANRTGRPFTGDYAGDLLYQTLARFGLSQGNYAKAPEDGLSLQRARIANAVRCVPPENKPTTEETKTCLSYLQRELGELSNLKAVVALGSIAHGALLTAKGLRKSHYRFGHAVFHDLPDGLLLADSYHCSRYNTNTGRLTEEMFEQVFAELLERLEAL